jgi:hypothetical protein
MHFRVTAIQDEGLPQELTDARLRLEDWLNATLGDTDFGCPNGCIMIVVFANSSLLNSPAATRLMNNEDGPTLALHIALNPQRVYNASASACLALLSEAIVQNLPRKALRKPKALDYESLRTSLVACVSPYAASTV